MIRRTHSVTLTLELTKAEIIMLRQTSLERVLNNASRVGSWAQDNGTDSIKDFGSTLWQDADELNPLATKLWNAARQSAAWESI